MLFESPSGGVETFGERAARTVTLRKGPRAAGMRFLKYFLIVILTVILMAAAGVYIVLTVYKNELALMVTNELRARHGISLSASDLRVSFFSNWPYGSVLLKDVVLTSDQLPGSRITGTSLSMSFNMRKLLHSEVEVKTMTLRHGEIRFVKPPPRQDIGGQGPQDTSANPVTFQIRRLRIIDTRLRMLNPDNGQDIAIDIINNTVDLRNFDDGLYAHLKGPVHVIGLQFRANRGRFLSKSRAELDLDISYLFDGKTLCIRPGSTAEVDGQRFGVTSVVYLGEEKRLTLMLDGNGLEYRAITRLMNHRIRKSLINFDVKKPFDAKVTLSASMGKRQDPAFVITVNGEHNDLLIGTSKVPYTDISFQGKIVCVDSSLHRGDVEKARIEFTRVKGKIYDFPFTAIVKVNNLTDPFLRISADLFIDASKIRFNLDKEFDLEGRAVASVTYSGPVDRLNRRQFLEPPMKLRARLDIKTLTYKEKERPWVYTLSGRASADNKDLWIDHMKLHTGVGRADMRGTAEGFVNYVLGNTHGFKADLTVNMDTLDLNAVFRTYAGADSTVAPIDPAAPAGIEPGDGELAEAAGKLKKTPSAFVFNIRLKAGTLLARKLTGSQARMHLRYADRQLEFPLLEMRTCDGLLKASGSVFDFNRISADVTIKDVDVTRLFREFENFGQNAITSDNLQGRLHMEADFRSRLTNRMQIAPETMYSEVRLSLKDGHLKNFEPVQKLSNFLFRNRDFNDISFSELNEAFIVRGRELEISELEIASSLLNVYVVNGVYNFRGHSNINLLVPWDNLKKRGRNYIPRSSEKIGETAKGLKLNFSGPANNMKVSVGHKEAIVMRPSI
jgi:hypothetical protein